MRAVAHFHPVLVQCQSTNDQLLYVLAFMLPTWPNAFDSWASTLQAEQNPKEEASKRNIKRHPSPLKLLVCVWFLACVCACAQSHPHASVI